MLVYLICVVQDGVEEEDMREFFSKYGTITDLVRMKDKETGRRIKPQKDFQLFGGFFRKLLNCSIFLKMITIIIRIRIMI